jgi:rRNA-processing protein FCF1
MGKLIVDSNVFINSFDQESGFREESIRFLSKMAEIGQVITMPAHGLFEITCALKRLSEHDRKYLHPVIFGQTRYPIEAIHIDQEFIAKYSIVEVPYIKAGDHLYLVVSKLNGYPLITRDNGLRERAKEAGINVFTPTEFLEWAGNA